MALQTTLFGERLYQGSDTKEVQKLLEKYPQAKDRPWLFFYLIMKERIPWVSQLSETQQLELKAFCRDLESLRRRRQECNTN